MTDKTEHVGDVLAQALCDMTARKLYQRAVRAERRAEAAEERERVLRDALEHDAAIHDDLATQAVNPGTAEDHRWLASRQREPLQTRAAQNAAGLTFAQLRNANNLRKTTPPAYHACADWTALDWLTALTGEVGELANYLKKWRRGDMKSDAPEIGREMADILIYLDILSGELGFDLATETTAKFNATSEKIGSDVRLPALAQQPVNQEK